MITMDKRFFAGSVAIAAAAAVLSGFATAGFQSTPNAVIAERYASEFEPSSEPARRAVDFAALRRQAAAALEDLKKKQHSNGMSTRLVPTTPVDCRQQTWPNIASDCLVTVNGKPARQPARYISTDRAIVAAL
jgi:hypothetical protein